VSASYRAPARRVRSWFAMSAILSVVAAGLVLGSAPSDAVDGGAVTGTVRLAGALAPEGAVRVVLRNYTDGLSDREVEIDASGAYRFDGVTPGGYDVFFDYLAGDAFADRWYSGGGGSLYGSRLAVDERGAVADVDLAKGGTIAGVVRAASGKAIPGVTVTATFASADFEDRIARSAVSDASGSYRISGLTAGPFELSFTHPSYPYQVRGQDILAGIPVHVIVVAGATSTGANMTMYRASHVTASITCYSCTRDFGGDVRIERQVVASNGVISWRDASSASFTGETLTSRDFAVDTNLVPGRYRAYYARGGQVLDLYGSDAR
jgi:hypothetical protein